MSIYYFDNAATTQLDEAVLEEILPYLKTNTAIHPRFIQSADPQKPYLKIRATKSPLCSIASRVRFILLRAEASLTTPRYSGFQPHAAKRHRYKHD